MTGFGRVVQKLPKQGSLLVEIKSGNHRFFDLNCRMPSFLSSLEIKARSLLKKSITRGSVTIYVEFSVPVNLLDVINTKRAKACFNLLNCLRKDIGISQTPTLDNILSIPGVISTNTKVNSLEGVTSYFESALKSALQRLIKTRKKEGKIILKEISKRASLIKKYLNKIIKYLKEQTKKKSVASTSETDDAIRQPLENLGGIAEEINRLKAHIESICGCLKQTGEMGKRLDFLAQELHREANTLGSKVQDIRIIKIVVDLKGEIEKIREQVQNVE